jgi:hypothetical protein
VREGWDNLGYENPTPSVLMLSPAQCVLGENIQHSYQLVVVKPRAQHRHATVLSSDIFSLDPSMEGNSLRLTASSEDKNTSGTAVVTLPIQGEKDRTGRNRFGNRSRTKLSSLAIISSGKRKPPLLLLIRCSTVAYIYYLSIYLPTRTLLLLHLHFPRTQNRFSSLAN